MNIDTRVTQQAGIYLASQSPRRSDLLTQIGVHHQVLNAPIDETAQADETPTSLVQRLAMDKAMNAWHSPQRVLPIPVLAADTLVVCDGQVLGKPKDDDDALQMLDRLAGVRHQVLSAVAILYAERQGQCLVASEVTFCPLSQTDILDYIASGEPMGKAGAYAIQGLAGMFVTNITGSYTAVVGLPLHETAELLRQFDVPMDFDVTSDIKLDHNRSA